MQTGERIRECEGAMSSIDQLKETVLGVERDSVWLLDKESGQSMEVPQASVALEMTPLQVNMPSPPSGASEKEGDQMTENPYEEVVVPPVRKPGGGRRRQLVFADPQMQLSNRTIKKQIGNPLVETQDLMEALLHLPELTKRATPRQLFSTPCGSVLDVILDMSKGDKSGSDAITPVSRWSPQEETPPPMEPIAEENIEMPKAQTESWDMLSWISSSLQFGDVTFSSLLPPEVDRTTAAHTFLKLLGESSNVPLLLIPNDTYEQRMTFLAMFDQ
ncbi:hypothetical protein EXN66_Car019138 [Channa argus]|uniref:Meiotic recombination protein REC8-like protein n=1 Tax=Channa argus TaxID=215402 RepID=A0A6G1QL68_CHAAH|nr:hypothetical protein EXN66_Car019138 [Channa argus]